MIGAKSPINALDPGGPAKRGALVIGLFFVVLVGWSAFSTLSSAAIAPGEVAVDSSRKTVQHLEGGIVKAIHVREGDEVRAGQLLIELRVL